MTGLAIFIGIVWAIVCLIWTKVNDSEGKELRRQYDEFVKRRDSFRKITGITVVFAGESYEEVTYKNAKSFDTSTEYLYVFDENDRTVGMVPHRRVDHVIIHREKGADA